MENVRISSQPEAKLKQWIPRREDYLIAFAYVSLVVGLYLLLLSKMVAEQILLQSPGTALLSQQSLGLTVVLFKLGGVHVMGTLVL